MVGNVGVCFFRSRPFRQLSRSGLTMRGAVLGLLAISTGSASPSEMSLQPVPPFLGVTARMLHDQRRLNDARVARETIMTEGFGQDGPDGAGKPANVGNQSSEAAKANASEAATESFRRSIIGLLAAADPQKECGNECPNGSENLIMLHGGASGWGGPTQIRLIGDNETSSGGQYKAGLSDMSLWLLNAAKVASALCARIVVPRPCTILSVDHNSGETVDCNTGWNHYVNISQLDRHNRARPLILPGGFNSSLPSGLSEVKDYDAALQAVKKGRSFVWHKRDSSAHDWNPGPHNCSNVLRFPTTSVLEARAQFFQREKIGSYISLHIRRGAALVNCDTDVPNVLNYVTCSLNNTGHAGFNGSIVILTDETDEAYLTQLKAAFKRRLPGVRVVHADAALRAAHPKEDNYFIFAITETLRMRDYEGLDKASFQSGWTSPRLAASLSLHWGHCVYCEDETTIRSGLVLAHAGSADAVRSARVTDGTRAPGVSSHPSHPSQPSTNGLEGWKRPWLVKTRRPAE